jgi:hypothetical protein
MRGAVGPNVLGRSTAEGGREDLLQLESATDHLTRLKPIVWRRQLVNGGFHAADSSGYHTMIETEGH